jgi:hypothetical protein
LVASGGVSVSIMCVYVWMYVCDKFYVHGARCRILRGQRISEFLAGKEMEMVRYICRTYIELLTKRISPPLNTSYLHAINCIYDQ